MVEALVKLTGTTAKVLLLELAEAELRGERGDGVATHCLLELQDG